MDVVGLTPNTLPKWKTVHILPLFPPGAVRGCTSQDFAKAVSVACHKNRADDVEQALKSYSAGIKVRGTEKASQGLYSTKRYGSSTGFPELKHGHGNSTKLPPVKEHRQFVCAKIDWHSGYDAQTNRQTHILQECECIFECVSATLRTRPCSWSASSTANTSTPALGRTTIF
jgi:hypothetical protein